MANVFKGTIIQIYETENVGKKKPFYKRIFIADDSVNEQYPNPIPFELTRDNISLIDGFKVGDDVRVEYYLNGRKWENPKTGKVSYFIAANAVKVFPLSAKQGADEMSEPADAPDEAALSDTDELPF